MKLRKRTALLLALLMALSLCCGALAEEAEGEYEVGDPTDAPELMLRSNPDAGWDWQFAFAKGGIAEINNNYYSMEMLQENDQRGVYEGEGGYTWMRIDGMMQGADVATFTCAGNDDGFVQRLTVAFQVDEALNVRVLGISTGEATLPELTLETPVRPIILQDSNPTTGYDWQCTVSIPQEADSNMLTAESEFLAAESTTGLTGAGGVTRTTVSGSTYAYLCGDVILSYARSWEDTAPLAKLTVSAFCSESADVVITGIKLD